MEKSWYYLTEFLKNDINRQGKDNIICEVCITVFVLYLVAATAIKFKESW